MSLFNDNFYLTGSPPPERLLFLLLSMYYFMQYKTRKHNTVSNVCVSLVLSVWDFFFFLRGLRFFFCFVSVISGVGGGLVRVHCLVFLILLAVGLSGRCSCFISFMLGLFGGLTGCSGFVLIWMSGVCR